MLSTVCYSMQIPNLFKRKVAAEMSQNFPLSYLVDEQYSSKAADFLRAVSERIVGIAFSDPNGTILAAGFLSGYVKRSNELPDYVEIAFRNGFKFESADSMTGSTGRAGFEMMPIESSVYPSRRLFLDRVGEIKIAMEREGTRNEYLWRRFNTFELSVGSPQNRFYMK